MSLEFKTQGGVGSMMPMSKFVAYMTGAKGASGFGSKSTAEEVAASWNGAGKVVIVTGAATGLGFETARVLAARGAEVIVTARDLPKASAAVAALASKLPPGSAKLLVPMVLDLSTLQSVRDFVAAFLATSKPLHALMNNGAVMACPFTLSPDGHEMQMATNHYGHFLLTVLLLDKLIDTAKSSGVEGRIVVTSSSAHHISYSEGIRAQEELDSPTGYRPWAAYGQSKLANVLFTRALNERLQSKGANVVAVTLHPGGINTSLQRHVGMELFMKTLARPFLKTIPQGAATQVYLATAPNVPAGEFFQNSNIFSSAKVAHDRELAERLWAISVKVTGAGEGL